jgi:hypothetical protein
VMTPPAKAGGFSEERLRTPTAASQATAQVSPCGHLSRLAPEGPIQALKRGTPCSSQGLTARYVPWAPSKPELTLADNVGTRCGVSITCAPRARWRRAIPDSLPSEEPRTSCLSAYEAQPPKNLR